ncbi:uncharacterized protein MELLADRAFT_85286 [Melampsora larici-populina 98AG31]|uniref:Fe2OG dioxygenase domain-containing protein n=1 Tax=Melampsora larici-populina (strain 98AG31 / pathotype 3-4-7) TaxID=747676 RepID=F4RI85_MELLP|nr:uncharacterized protein MELLADRAFT_85286 [Melampsora larici-populina 98AG31]EGG07962.1 hypothetical protein MELLADRAFT_85286 [Melampsora larici-populina 98AG31]
MILNLYKPHQGIKPHVDLLDRFDDLIIGISLGSSVIMDFENQIDPFQSERVYLQNRSCYILSNQVRFHWFHGIKSNQSFDYIYDPLEESVRKIQRSRTRISITIRRLKEGAEVIGDDFNRSSSSS